MTGRSSGGCHSWCKLPSSDEDHHGTIDVWTQGPQWHSWTQGGLYHKRPTEGITGVTIMESYTGKQFCLSVKPGSKYTFQYSLDCSQHMLKFFLTELRLFVIKAVRCQLHLSSLLRRTFSILYKFCINSPLFHTEYSKYMHHYSYHSQNLDCFHGAWHVETRTRLISFIFIPTWQSPWEKAKQTEIIRF